MFTLSGMQVAYGAVSALICFSGAVLAVDELNPASAAAISVAVIVGFVIGVSVGA